MSLEINYKPDGKTLCDFMRSDKFFRGIRGPVGSGKSVCSAIELFRRATQQEPGPDGIRRSRAAVIRNTNPQLRTTTIKTWLDWFPEESFGRFIWSPPYTHRIKVGDIEMEVIFLALDKPEDVKKLLSLELTFCWVNEAREVPKAIIDACTMRVGRYPSMRDGGPTWFGVIADTNAPEEDHWWPIMADEAPIPDYIPPDQAMMLVRPESWDFFTQPPGMLEDKDKTGALLGYSMNPLAENMKNITNSYYARIIEGKTRSWIDVYVLNKLGALIEGKQVYGSFNRTAHVAKEPIPANPDLDLIIGIDFGLTPAAIFAQKTPRGRWLILRELICTDMGAVRFAETLKYTIATHFPDHKERCKIWGDPAGDFRAQTDETTPFKILRSAGVMAFPAPTNDPVVRIEAVTLCLERMVDGQPGFLLDPGCKVLIAGFESGYHYNKLNLPGAERYGDKPEKNRFSHPHDALQYLACGSGESRNVLTGGRKMEVVRPQRDYDIFKRAPRKPRERHTRFEIS
jgi:hypothetical protein